MCSELSACQEVKCKKIQIAYDSVSWVSVVAPERSGTVRVFREL